MLLCYNNRVGSLPSDPVWDKVADSRPGPLSRLLQGAVPRQRLAGREEHTSFLQSGPPTVPYPATLPTPQPSTPALHPRLVPGEVRHPRQRAPSWQPGCIASWNRGWQPAQTSRGPGAAPNKFSPASNGPSQGGGRKSGIGVWAGPAPCSRSRRDSLLCLPKPRGPPPS